MVEAQVGKSILNDLAPIGLSTYSRLGHLKQTVESLQKNELASESEVYIFSDAPKQGDEDKVQAVRDYLKTIDGFKAVHIYEREENNRVENNRGGMRMLLEKYGRMIFLEEDNITSPIFLRYMNGALDFYKDDPSISSITGYCPPIHIPLSYRDDVFILAMFDPWGMGMWKDSFEKVKYISQAEYSTLVNDKKKMKLFLKGSGNQLAGLIEMEMLGILDAFDIKAIFWQFINSTFTVYPRKSLVHNIGQDGSGAHMGVSSAWDVDLWQKDNDFKFVNELKINHEIEKLNYKFYDIGIKEKLVKRLKAIGLYSLARFIFHRIKKHKYLLRG